MIDKSMPGNGAMTDGVYQGQITDITSRADPEIDVEIVELDDNGEAVELEVEDIIADSHESNLLETVFADEAAYQKIQSKASEWITQ